MRRDPPAWQRPEGLTDERRVQLQNLILERREANPVHHTDQGPSRIRYIILTRGLVRSGTSYRPGP